jgi:hypothetical protein
MALVYLLTPATFPDLSKLALVQSPDSFQPGLKYGDTNSYVIKDVSSPIAMDSWQLKIQDTTTESSKLWLVVRYVLAKRRVAL